MAVKLDVFPYDVAVGRGDTKTFLDYEHRLVEAMNWLEDMDLIKDEHYRFGGLTLERLMMFEFKRQKHAMMFKMAWG